jgi:protoporphyrinogen/coproporphyrinogen III oxidase
MTRIAIVGGGISGLAAAFALERRRLTGSDLEYFLFESSSRLGGTLRTENVDGCVVEAGPDSFLTEKPWAAELCRTLGISDQLIGSNDAERKTYILTRGRLEAMPDGLMFMVPTKILPTALSPLFSWTTKFRMAREWIHPPKPVDRDESVAAFVERHYGTEMVDRLADPLLSGVYGGEAASLSVRAVLARFAEMERTHGSLGRAMLAARKKSRRASATAPPIFTSLKNGMQQLVEAVIARLPPASLLVNTRVESIRPEADGWKIDLHSEAGARSESFDGVILAVPAYTAGGLVKNFASELATELVGIGYTSSIAIGLGYDGEVRRLLPPGFGFLVPRSEGRLLLAATFVHNKFSYRAPADRALLRCFFAGAGAEKVWGRSDAEIVDLVRQELSEILGLRAAPRFARVFKWKSAMPQYGVGHLERMERIERLLAFPKLALCGNGYRGIGIPDCVREGEEAAERVRGLRL